MTETLLNKFSTLALVMGLMLSSESLILLGNNMGDMGIFFLVAIFFAIIVHIFTALSYGELFVLFPGPASETQSIRRALGPVPAIFFPLCSKVVLTICISTGILATAGFVFNEVFVYWFPNFAFAFVLLGFLLTINLLGQPILDKIQIVFVMAAIAGLLFLSAIGLSGLGNTPSIPEEINPVFNIKVGSAGLLLFVGFDLAGFFNGDNPVKLVKSIVVGILLVGVVFSLWGLVSINYVSPEKLAATTIPYTVTARKILGQEGRIIMGVVVLAGICSAVNVLLAGVSRMMVGMADQGLLPPFLAVFRDRAVIPLILLAIGIASMMAMGMAGSPSLEVYVRAGLLFWLLNYAVVHLSVLIMRKRINNRSQIFRAPGYPTVPVIGLIAIFMSFVGLLWLDTESGLMFKFMLVISAIVLFFSFAWIGLGRRWQTSG